MVVKYGSLPFDAQIAFFKQKINVPAASWTDLWQTEHDHAFAVAGALRKDLISDLRQAVQDAIEQGTTLAQFRKDFDQIVEKNFWAYKGKRGWRTRVIYETNLRTSYAAGRYEQLQKLEYWQYHHSIGANNPREQHLAWNGLVLPNDDPFWQTHYPPNGWGCRCYVTGMSKSRLKQRGLDVSASPKIEFERKIVGIRSSTPRTVDVPKGVSPGFAYAPGQSWFRQMTPKLVEGKVTSTSAGMILAKLPMARSAQPKPLPEDWSDKKYSQWFLDEFGANGKPYAIHQDAVGQVLVLTDELFKDHKGALKLRKHDRHLFLPALAETLKDPDQIRHAWQPVKRGADTLRRRYIKVFDTQPYGMAVFEFDGDKWREITIFHITDEIVKAHAVDTAEDYIKSYLTGDIVYEKK